MTIEIDRTNAEAGTVTTALWWQEPFRMFQTNLREIDATLNVEEVLDYIEDFGAGAWLLSVGGIISGYPSDLDFQTPNPRLMQRPSGDLVGDAVIAAHRRGVKVMARMDFSKVDRKIAEEHPEWCYVDSDGGLQVYNGLTSVCPSGQYYQERVFNILEEVLGRYPLDGFFFNWLTYGEIDYAKRYRGVCHCLACQKAFAEFAPGTPMPTGPESSGYLTWQRFSTQMLDDWTARARDFIAQRRPEAPLILGTTSDIVFHEANNAIDRPLWHHLCTEHVSVARTGRQAVPVLVNAAAFVDMPYRLAGEEPHAYQQYLVQAIARGANPSIYIMGTPDTVDYECLETGSDLIRFHRDHNDVYRSYRSAAVTALVRPDPLKRTGRRAAEATAEFQGLWLSLLERHIPFDILAEERIPEAADNGELAHYRLLVLPDLGEVTHPTVAALDNWVHDGGHLLSTGEPAVSGSDIQLASLPLDGRVAVKDTPEATWSSHVVPDTTDGGSAYPMPLFGAYHVVTPAADTHTGMHILSRAPYGPPEKCYGHYDLHHPGWISGSHGRGGSVVVPWTVGRAYRTIGLSAYRDLVGDLAKQQLGTDLQLTTDLPEQVEIILAESLAGMVVHLRNVSGAMQGKFAQPLAVPPSRLTLKLNRPIAAAVALVSGAQLELNPTTDGYELSLPAIGLFEVLVLS